MLDQPETTAANASNHPAATCHAWWGSGKLPMVRVLQRYLGLTAATAPIVCMRAVRAALHAFNVRLDNLWHSTSHTC
jgi:hypothetical protein